MALARRTALKKILVLLGGFSHWRPSAGAQSVEFLSRFDPGRQGGPDWQISSWANGAPFGCTFSEDCVHWDDGMLTLSFSGATGKGAEVRTRRFWRHGVFMVDMQPANVPGTISSFFLYDGKAATSTHFEIDLEFIGGSSLLHTNYWIAGKEYPQAIDLCRLGIDPYAGSRRYAFAWLPDTIVWQVKDDAGQWLELRRQPVELARPMQLMMNVWYGDNVGSALNFPGYYDGTPGKAEYRGVWVGQ